MSGVETARKLRRDQTKPESVFWNVVRNRQFLGLKWERQVPIDRYVADFVCEDEKLIIELDGGQHNSDDNMAYDEKRTQILEQHGYRVIRLWNKDITDNMNDVLRILQQCVGQTSPHPAAAKAARTSPRGEVNLPNGEKND